jgi:hypothetical protein
VGNNSLGYTDPFGLSEKPALSAEEYEIEFVKAYDEYLNLKESIY